MSIDVGTTIPVPADTDNYNLILDLVTLRNAVVGSFEDVISELGQRPETGSAASFFSINCTSTGKFGTSVTVGPSDSGNDLIINNSAASFGLSKAGVSSLLHTGGRWVTPSRIETATPINPLDASTKGYVDSAVSAEATARANAVVNLENKSVLRYNGNQLWAPNANYANIAGYAETAGSSTPTAHSHPEYQPAGSYAPADHRPAVYTGLRDGIGSVPAKGTKDFTLALPISGVYPSFLGLTVIDVNGDEVFAQVRSGWGTPHSVPCRLRNVSTSSETVRVMWMAVY